MRGSFVFSFTESVLGANPQRPNRDDAERWDIQFGDVIQELDGSYDHSVRMYFSKPVSEGKFAIVNLTYAPDGLLTVEGSETTYSDNIHSYNFDEEEDYRESLARYVEGIDQAFENPRIVEATPRRIIPKLDI